METVTPPVVVVKKKPGRPKKKIPDNNIEIRGIVNAPIHNDDIVELVYDNPMMFRKILHLLKSYHAHEVEISFQSDHIQFSAIDHIGKTVIFVNVKAPHMNLYYCKNPIKICVKGDNLDQSIGTVSRNHSKITFVLREADYRTHLHICMKDTDYDNDDVYQLDVVHPSNDLSMYKFDDDANYPVRFKMSMSHFKGKISSITKLTKFLVIQRNRGDSLQFTFDKEKGGLVWTGLYTQEDKLNLTIDDNSEMFRVSVAICYITPFTKANIGNQLTISIDKQEQISFFTSLDERADNFVADVKIFTKIRHN